MNNNGSSPGTELVSAAAPERSTGVLGTVDMAGGELVVRVRPQRQPRDVTVRPVGSRPDPTTLAAVSCMRYVGPLTPAQAAEHHQIVAYCRRHPWWAWLQGWTR